MCRVEGRTELCVCVCVYVCVCVCVGGGGGGYHLTSSVQSSKLFSFEISRGVFPSLFSKQTCDIKGHQGRGRGRGLLAAMLAPWLRRSLTHWGTSYLTARCKGVLPSASGVFSVRLQEGMGTRNDAREGMGTRNDAREGMGTRNDAREQERGRDQNDIREGVGMGNGW